MNSKLKEVIDAVCRLSDKDQEELAYVILEELESEAKWQALFEASKPQLKRLAEEADEEYRAGRTEPLDPDTL
jgi:hypothetical protein